MRLLLKDYRGGSARTLKEQLARTESYVEQVLYYLRSQVPEKDYVIQEYSLRTVTDHVIGENKVQFYWKSCENQAGNRRRLCAYRRKVAEFYGRTDFEQCCEIQAGGRLPRFICGVRKQGITSLHIRDNGRGIAPEDLPRVFEKSFTGKNGRTGQASTGIGLYLCKKLSQRLGHRVEIESEEMLYTEVILSFEQDAYNFNLTAM